MAVAAGGWYFALAAIGPDVAIILGLLYGIFLFPRFVLPRLSPIPIWGRVALIAGAAGLFVYWIVSPLLPRAPVAALNYSVERVTPGDKPVIGDVGQDKALADAVAALNLHGDVHGGIGGGVSGDTNVPAIDLEMIALEPITRKTKLLLPKTGYVVYVLDKGVWTAYPAIAKSNKRKLTVEPGTDPSHEGAKVTIDDAPGSDAFIWYPVISKSNR